MADEALVVIDLQNDFCPGGALAVAGGDEIVPLVNDLIRRHNRWYPAEARLPMDPRTGDFALVNGKPYRREPLDPAWALQRLPPSLGEARAVVSRVDAL